MKAHNKYSIKKLLVLFVVLMIANVVAAQTGGGAHPGADPEGMSVPIDGGLLMALLAGGGIITMFFKKKKKEE